MKFELNFPELHQNLNKPRVFKYSEVKDRLVKVAFDIVRFRDGNKDIDGLWEVQTCSDGEVIVAKYSDEEPVEKTSSWEALADRSGENLTIFYKNTPVTRLKTAGLGLEAKDAVSVSNILPELLDSNPKFKQALLKMWFNQLPASEREALLAQFPELTNKDA